MKELFELLGKIRIDMTGFDDALKEVDAKAKTVEDKFTSVGEAMSNVGGKMTKGITVPAIAAAGAAVKIGADFEESMSKVSALTGASEKEMSKLEDTARDLGKTTAFSAKEAADGMSFLGMAGFKTNEIVSAMPAVLDLAGAGQLDLADAADIASNVLSGFGMEANEAGHMADVLAKAATNANTDVGQLGDIVLPTFAVTRSTKAC